MKNGLSQKVNFGVSVALTEDFTLNFQLSEDTFERALGYWTRIGLNPVEVKRPISSPDFDNVKSARFRVEGGTLWTNTVEKYRKIVSCFFTSVQNYTFTQVRMELPGAWGMNSNDIETAKEMILAFVDTIQPTRSESNETVQQSSGEIPKPIVQR